MYPNTDLTDTVYHSKSVENVDDPLLSKATIDWFYEHYLADPDKASNPMASPIMSTGLSGLPPALILTAGYDPLRDEGAAYAARLISSGIAVTHIHYPALPHAFIQLIGVIDAAQAGPATYLGVQAIIIRTCFSSPRQVDLRCWPMPLSPVSKM
ncbi:alpha/beta hydrolase fold domain-containing protein [Agrobacterium tumefaciens]|uniref:alpha/beta hydrolase fold domain-containing protein n=1 Tax=Agrobacterium tumefaciens TaxID=358 RepID=UPI00396A3112